jgi:Protein of unknown function (DUF4232)
MKRAALVTGCIAGLVAALLAGCSSHGAPASPGAVPVVSADGASTVPGRSVAPAATAADHPAPGVATDAPVSPAATADCAGADLSLAQLPGDSGAGGTVVTAIAVNNRGSHACTIAGYPEFTLTGPAGSPTPAILHGGSGPAAFTSQPGPVTVPAGGVAGFLIAYQNRPSGGATSCVRATGIRLAVGQGTVTGAVAVPVCGESVRVSPYLPQSRLSLD